MELKKIHMRSILQMPGGTSEILNRGEKNGVETRLFYTEGLICVKREIEGVSHTRLVPLNNILSMEEYGGESVKKEAQGGSQQSAVESGAKTSSGRGRKKKTG